MTDRDRSALYAAELAAFDGTDLEACVGVAEIVTLVGRVLAHPWWPGGPVVVRRARSDASTSTTTCRSLEDGAVIRIAGPQATVATAAHELAHVLAGVAHGHGPVYRRAYLDVVSVITNLDSTDRRHELHVDQLAEALAAARLVVGKRSWPAPPASASSAFAL